MDLHSSLLLASAAKCIQVAKWRGIPDFLTDGWSVLVLAQNSSTCVKTKIRRVLLSCRWHGSSCIQPHFLRCYGWQSLSKWHLQLSELCCQVLRLCLLQELSPLSLLQCKNSFARVQVSSPHGPAGACSKSRNKSCISLVGHCHLHVTSDGWSLSQCCQLSVCLSFLGNVKTLELWFLSPSCFSILSSKSCLRMHCAIIAATGLK